MNNAMMPFTNNLIDVRVTKRGDVVSRLTRKDIQRANPKQDNETAKQYRLRINTLMDRADSDNTENVLNNIGVYARKTDKRVKVCKLHANGDVSITLTNRKSELDTEIAKARAKLEELEAMKAESEAIETETVIA